MYYAVFLMRRVIFIFLMVLFSGTPIVAIGVQSVACIFMILYIVIARPFKRRVSTALTILGELYVIAFHGIALGIMDPDQPDEENQQFGFLIVIMFSIVLVVGFSVTIVQVI